jgi:copper resistance protein D
MDIAIVLARAFHFISVISLAGVFAFVVFISVPAFQRAGPDLPSGAAAFRRDLSRLAWTSLVVALISGGFWLILQASSMSGTSFGEVFSGDIIATVLERTQFGRVWSLRAVLAVVLAGCLAAGGRVGYARAGTWLRRTSWLISAALLATLSWAGHGGASRGLAGDVHVVADVAHLLAAGSWIGALPPLAFLCLRARRAGDLPWARVADDAMLRFSTLGLITVGTLLVTGSINSWFLVGSVPALVGTTYGRLLLVKLGLFIALVGVAAINRQVLAPRLSAAPLGPGAARHWTALRLLQYNVVVEIALGMAILLVVSTLGTTPPAAHSQPQWPFAYRLSLEAAEALPYLRNDVVAASVIAVLGLGVLIYGISNARYRRRAITAGLALFLGAGWWPFDLLAVPAYPSSFYISPVRLTTAAVARGALVYDNSCVACHGAEGRGDGPGAKDLQVPPADLTAEHIFGHSDGELFWWISHGMAGGSMPGFASALDEMQIWEVISFIHARAAGVQASDMSAEVTAFPAPLAPDFAWQSPRGEQGTLSSAASTGAVLLVFFTPQQSQQRLDQLAGWHDDLAALGITLLAVPVTGKLDSEGGLPDFAVAAAAETPATYALFERRARAAPSPPPAGHMEFLVDSQRYLRARWQPGDRPGWDDIAELRRQVSRMAALPLAPAVHAGHVH